MAVLEEEKLPIHQMTVKRIGRKYYKVLYGALKLDKEE